MPRDGLKHLYLHEGTAPLRKCFMLHALVGWAGVVLLALLQLDLASFSTPSLWLILAAIVGVIIFAALGVLKRAEALAAKLGDPYGTLILTISIMVIEVTLIVAVLLGPGSNPTIARDSTIAAAMLLLTLFLGLAILLGTLKHGDLKFNPRGLSVYLSVSLALITLIYFTPVFVGETSAVLTAIAVATLATYIFFLWRLTGPQAQDFAEESITPTDDGVATWKHTAWLLITAAPIVLLSNYMAAFLDESLARADAPTAISGLVIAAIVLTPEALTTFRAALQGQMQRVVNLTHGALVSVMGTTVPIVIIIAFITGQDIILAESPGILALLMITLMMWFGILSTRRVTAAHGVASLVLFSVYLMVLSG